MAKDEEDFNSPAIDAYERVVAREPPTDKDASITEPLLKKLAEREGIPYLIVQDGFVLGFDGRLYPDLLGGHYVRRILQAAGRTLPIDRRISALELDSEGAMGSGGMLYTSDVDSCFEGCDDDDGYDWETSYTQSSYEEVIPRSEMRLMVAEKKKLEDQGYTVETSKDLEFYTKELDSITHQGRIDQLDQDREKVRQTVFQDIHDWYKKLEGEEFGTDVSRKLATHFRKHIKTGSDCWYTGDWKWIFY